MQTDIRKDAWKDNECRGNGLSRLPGMETNGKACGCALAARNMAGPRLDLAETVPFAERQR